MDRYSVLLPHLIKLLKKIQIDRKLSIQGIRGHVINEHHSTLQHTVHCSPVQYSTVQYTAVQYTVAQYSTLQHGTVQYTAAQYSTVHCSTVQYNWVQYSWVQYRTLQYSWVQYTTVPRLCISLLHLQEPWPHPPSKTHLSHPLSQRRSDLKRNKEHTDMRKRFYTSRIMNVKANKWRWKKLSLYLNYSHQDQDPVALCH